MLPLLINARGYTNQFLRRNFGSEDRSENFSLPTRASVVQYLENKFGRYAPFFTYTIVIVFMICFALLFEVSPNDSIVSTIKSSDGGSNELDSNKNADGKIKSSKSFLSRWILPSLVFILFFYSVLMIMRILRSIAIMRTAATRGTNNSRERLRRLLTQLSQLNSNGNPTVVGNDFFSRLRVALTSRDFNGNDYELLRQLDETNELEERSRGADESVIARLPSHIVTQSEIENYFKDAGHDVESNSNQFNSRRSCPICLEPYVVGDEVKTVLCLHQFHGHCIDRWLRTNATCPVCKSHATE
jgi:hypothetical protein